MTADPLRDLIRRLESLRQQHLALAEEHAVVTRKIEKLLADRQAVRDQLERKSQKPPERAE